MTSLARPSSPAEVPQHIVLSDVSWDYYEHTLAEIGNRKIRVAYLDGMMEIISWLAAQSPDEPEHVVLPNVSWAYYEHTLAEIGNRKIRVAYLDGAMEIMSPLPEHEGASAAIAQLILALTEERQIQRKSFGSPTFRREEKGVGVEPDACFYLFEIESVKRMKRFDPLVHRAPDLWVEVDVCNASVSREPIYAELGVPEVWRYNMLRLDVRLLGKDGLYTSSMTSSAFPFMPIDQFSQFIPQVIDGNEIAVIGEFRQWIRTLPR